MCFHHIHLFFHSNSSPNLNHPKTFILSNSKETNMEFNLNLQPSGTYSVAGKIHSFHFPGKDSLGRLRSE